MRSLVEGMSRRAAAARFGVSESVGDQLGAALRADRVAEAAKMGGHKR